MPRLNRNLLDAIKFLLPFFAFLSVFIIYPMIASFYYTLNDIHLSDLKPAFIGLDNYIKLFRDSLFIRALYQTLSYLVFHTAVGVPLGLAIALLFNTEFKGRAAARVCLLIPWATPPIVAAVMFFIMFNPGFGPVIYTLEQFNLVPHKFSIFANPDLALFGLAVVSLWKSAPLFAFIFLSALQNIPIETLESAKIYGSSQFAIMRRITIPFLKPTIAVNSILSCILALAGTQAFDLVMGITQGGPAYRTYMLYFLAWHTAFPWDKLGYGSTIAYIVTIVAVLFAMAFLRIWYKR